MRLAGARVVVCVVGSVAAAAVGAAACARVPTPEPVPAPASVTQAPVQLEPPVTDLSGGWATGSEPAAEPGGPSVTLHPGCTHNPAVWLIKQTGNAIEAWAFPESYNKGVVEPGPGPAKISPASGQISGRGVVIQDGGVQYALRYDEESGHLRGTRGGRPFWAVRQVVVRTEACVGVP